MARITWAGIFLLLLAACSTSKITSSWKAKDGTPKNYDRILVLGLINDNDRSIQENMEKHFVADLQNLGYTALSSLKEFGPKAFDKMDEQAVIQKLKTNEVDAIITIVLLDKARESKYVSGGINSSPNGYYYNFWGYRSTLSSRIYEPGYYITDTKYFWESNVYDMSTQQLVYSVQTQSFDPSNTATMAHEYGKMIVKDMVKQHVIGAKLTGTNTPSSAQ